MDSLTIHQLLTGFLPGAEEFFTSSSFARNRASSSSFSFVRQSLKPSERESAGIGPSLANRTYNDWSDPYDLIQISKMAVECTNQTEQLSQIAPQLRSVLDDLKASIASDNSHTETVQEIRKILGNLDARLNGKASAKVSSTAGR